jgi:hypothetical protein
MKDLFNNIHPARAISPQVAKTDNTPFVSQIIAMKGFQSLTWLIVTGSLADADATFTVLAEHGDDPALADAAAVPDDLLLGTEVLAGFRFDDDNKVRKLGYVGHKPYVRLTITPANNTGDAYVAAIALLGHPLMSPTPNPPA